MLGRSDTIILATIIPLKPYVGLLSIPRDLWVEIPEHNENRINTAHFFGEAEQPGGGPSATIEAIKVNFGVDVDYFARLRFTGISDIVDAYGGIDIDFPQAMSGYAAGQHHFDGEQALALVRDRQGSDDFFRMERAQMFISALVRQSLRPSTWSRLPQVLTAVNISMDINIPFWLWPRLGLALLRAGPGGIQSHTINREMVTPFTTSGGAAVLAPNWDLIKPLVLELFGQ